MKRLEKRLAGGMIDEVKNVLTKLTLLYGEVTPRAIRKCGLEYVAITNYVQGTSTEKEMKEEIITKSMQYVKRQETWNKKYLSIAKIIEVT